jgi:hypothetical protein
MKLERKNGSTKLEEISEKGEETASLRKDATPEVPTEGIIFSFVECFLFLMSICFSLF